MAWILTDADIADLKTANPTTVTDDVVTRLKSEIVGKPDFGDKTAFQAAIKTALDKSPVMGGNPTERGALATKVADYIAGKQSQGQQPQNQQQQSQQPQNQQPQTPQQWKLAQADLDQMKTGDTNFTPEIVAKLQADVVPNTYNTKAEFETAVRTAINGAAGAATQAQKDAAYNKVVTAVAQKTPTAPQTPATPPGAGLPASTPPANTATMFSANINVSYSRKWGFEMTGASKVSAKIVAVPAPQAFLDALEDARAGLTKRNDNAQNP